MPLSVQPSRRRLNIRRIASASCSNTFSTPFPSGSGVWGQVTERMGFALGRAKPRRVPRRIINYYDGGNAVLETKADGTIVGMNIFAPDGLVTRWSKLSGTIPIVGDYQFDWQGNAVHCLFSGARYADEPLIHSAYNAWGQRNFVYSNGAGSVSDLLRFGYSARWGYKLDTETGLYYCQHRYYDPQNGRWVNRDPMGYFGGFNLMAYCFNRPITQKDATGFSVRICRRNLDYNDGGFWPAVGGQMGADHWWLETDTPGCESLGYGPGGSQGESGNQGNMLGAECYTIPSTPAQEACVCQNGSDSLNNGWKLNGSSWTDQGDGDYNFATHNCQSFTDAVTGKCGLTIPWPKQSPLSTCNPPCPTSPHPSGPNPGFPKPPGVSGGGYPNPLGGGRVAWD